MRVRGFTVVIGSDKGGLVVVYQLAGWCALLLRQPSRVAPSTPRCKN
jgi:hypothetical protein